MSGWVFVVEGVKPYDGEYEFDPSREMTTTEWGWVKRLSGCLPNTIRRAFADGDPELMVALLVVAMHHAGKVEKERVLAVADRLFDAPFGSAVKLRRVGAEVAAEDPPADAATTPQTPSGGESSSPASDPSDETP